MQNLIPEKKEDYFNVEVVIINGFLKLNKIEKKN